MTGRDESQDFVPTYRTGTPSVICPGGIRQVLLKVTGLFGYLAASGIPLQPMTACPAEHHD